MSITTTRFTNEKAPCGRTVDGERFRDRDDECLLSDELFYDCGCRSIRHEYHDGSVYVMWSTTTVRSWKTRSFTGSRVSTGYRLSGSRFRVRS